MEKLPLCRICLIDDIDYLIEPTQLQNVYEKLTSIPFQTNDLRPQTMCYICYGKLQAINRFMLKCLKAEKLLSQMLNCDNEVDLQAKIKRLIPKSYQMHTTVIEQNNIESDIDDDIIKHDIKHEPDDEMQDIYETEFVAIETDLVSQLKECEVTHLNENIDDGDKNTYIRTSDANDNQQDNERERKDKIKERNRENQRTWRQRQKDLKKKDSKEGIEEEKKRKVRNREYQRTWRQRQKDLKKKDSKEGKEEEKKRKEWNREYYRAWRQRKKYLKKNDKNVEELFQKNLGDLQIKREKLDSNEDQENVVQFRASQNLVNVKLEQNQFLIQQLGIYEESHECVTPEVILHRNKDIPGDGNCLFHSLIRVLQLQISTCDLRRQLRDSPYLNSCHNPQEAYKILSSNNEYGDLDCLYLFAKIYNQNICVHYQYFNVISKDEDTRFCHFNSNDTHNWIHLDLRELHFTPYFTDDEKVEEDERKQKQKNREYSKRYRDKKRHQIYKQTLPPEMC